MCIPHSFLSLNYNTSTDADNLSPCYNSWFDQKNHSPNDFMNGRPNVPPFRSILIINFGGQGMHSHLQQMINLGLRRITIRRMLGTLCSSGDVQVKPASSSSFEKPGFCWRFGMILDRPGSWRLIQIPLQNLKCFLFSFSESISFFPPPRLVNRCLSNLPLRHCCIFFQHSSIPVHSSGLYTQNFMFPYICGFFLYSVFAIFFQLQVNSTHIVILFFKFH